MKENKWIKELDMISHPEGGYYKETYSSEDLTTEAQGPRKRWTSIYFLLEKGEVSHFHKLKSDEMWYFHDGNPLTVYMIQSNGQLVAEKLGLDIKNNEKPQLLVPKGTIFGSAMNAEGYSLVGCMVAPGFDFQDFKLYERKELMDKYPNHEEIITKLTREK